MIEIIEITKELRQEYNPALLEFEKIFKYPFSQDSFIINHGDNHFAFSDRLGKSYILVAKEVDKIIGV